MAAICPADRYLTGPIEILRSAVLPQVSELRFLVRQFYVDHSGYGVYSFHCTHAQSTSLKSPINPKLSLGIMGGNIEF